MCHVSLELLLPLPLPHLLLVFNMGNPWVNFRVPVAVPVCTCTHVSWVRVSMGLALGTGTGTVPIALVGGYVGPYFPTLFYFFFFLRKIRSFN